MTKEKILPTVNLLDGVWHYIPRDVRQTEQRHWAYVAGGSIIRTLDFSYDTTTYRMYEWDAAKGRLEDGNGIEVRVSGT